MGYLIYKGGMPLQAIKQINIYYLFAESYKEARFRFIYIDLSTIGPEVLCPDRRDSRTRDGPVVPSSKFRDLKTLLISPLLSTA